MKRILFVLVLALLGFYVAWPAFSAFRLKQGLEARDPALVASKIDLDRLRQSLRPVAEREAEKIVDEAIAKSGAFGASLGAQLKTQFMGKIVDHALTSLVTPEIVIRIHAEHGNVKDAVVRAVKEQTAKLTGVPGPAGIGGLGDMLSGAFGSGQHRVTGPAANATAAKPSASPVRTIATEEQKPAPKPVTSPVRTISTDQQPAAEEKPAEPRRKLGIANVKSAGLDGPLGVYVGIAKDETASEPDVTVHMGFTGDDWKLVGLVPKQR